MESTPTPPPPPSEEFVQVENGGGGGVDVRTCEEVPSSSSSCHDNNDKPKTPPPINNVSSNVLQQRITTPTKTRPVRTSSSSSTMAMFFGGESSEDNNNDNLSEILSPTFSTGGGGGGRRFWGDYGSSWLLSRLGSSSGSSSNGNANSRRQGSSEAQESCLRDPTSVERQNLLNITKLVIKELIEWSLRHGRSLEPEHPPLQHFFIVLEHAMRHGLKPKKGLLGPKKELWDVLQLVEKYTSGAEDITSSIRDLPTVSTHQGRARAFMRLAIMQRKLADYFKVLVDLRDDVLPEFYEPFALMMSDEAVILSGLLVGLNVIECNFCLKEEDLDSQQGVIDFSLYLRSSRSSDSLAEGGGGDPSKDDSNKGMDSVLDQKNYIEELNRHLNATVTNLQSRVETLTTTNALLSEDLARAKKVMASLQEENKVITNKKNNLLLLKEKADGGESLKDEEQENSSTNNKTKIDEIERENEILKSKNREMESAMKSMEKDVHEKQDTIISLRKQLEDIKSINLEMYRKLQECESSVKFKTELCEKLEEKVGRCDETLRIMEEKVSNANAEVRLAQKESRSVCVKLGEKELQLSTVEGDLRVEREWRMSLQEVNQKEREKGEEMKGKWEEEKRKNQDLALNLEMAGREMALLRQQCRDQELTLEEMGVKVAESKLLADEMKEAGGLLRWKRDRETVHCKSCNKEFNLTRRRHHCRNCGEIFCAQCSDNSMELASSAKPVRVCDSCYTKSLARFNTPTTPILPGTGGTLSLSTPSTPTSTNNHQNNQNQSNQPSPNK